MNGLHIRGVIALSQGFLITSIIYSAVVAFVIDYFDTSVKTPGDVESFLGLPVIGVVPAFGGRR